MRTSMKNAFAQFKVNLRYAKKRLPVVNGREPKFEFISASIQKTSHGMKRNLISESYM